MGADTNGTVFNVICPTHAEPLARGRTEVDVSTGAAVTIITPEEVVAARETLVSACVGRCDFLIVHTLCASHEALRVECTSLKETHDVALQRAFNAEGALGRYDHEASKRALRIEVERAENRAISAEYRLAVAEQRADSHANAYKIGEQRHAELVAATLISGYPSGDDDGETVARALERTRVLIAKNRA